MARAMLENEWMIAVFRTAARRESVHPPCSWHPLITFLQSKNTRFVLAWIYSIVSVIHSVTAQKPLTVWTTTNYSKSLKKWECLTTLSISWDMWDRKQQLELYMEQLIGSKLGKEYDKAVYCPPAYLTYMQNTSWERPDWRNPNPCLLYTSPSPRD